MTETTTTTKTCTKCGELKPFSAFSPNKLGRHGLQAACRTCRTAADRARRATPEGRAARASSRTASTATTLQALTTNQTDPRHGTRYGYRVGCRCRRCTDAANAGIAAWRTTAAGRANDRRMKARRRARQADALRVEYDDREIHARDHGYCYACGIFIAVDEVNARGRRAWEVEHLVPIAAGGADAPWNLAISCNACNSSKGARSPYSWAAERDVELPHQLLVEAWDELRSWHDEDVDDVDVN